MPRKRITQSTVQGMAGEVAALPLAPGRARLHAEVLEGLMSEIEKLRELPLKEVEPAFVYRPVELKARKGK